MAKPPPQDLKPQDKRQQIVEAAVAHLLEHGLANSGLRALAKSAGKSDRMVMYYFATKDDLISEALAAMAEAMAANLAALIPQKRTSASHILETMRAASADPEVHKVLRLWFEIVGRAVAGEEPYRSTAATILDNWEAWLREKLPPAQANRAPELLAQIEGELMLTLIRG